VHLVRAPRPDNEGVIYLKVSADLPLFVNEALVARSLGSLLPGFVPVPLAIDAARGWLALADFGEVVGWEAPADVKIEVIRRFARLQIASADWKVLHHWPSRLLP
jgi:hypothetical protein